MRFQARQDLGGIVRVSVKDGGPGDDATLDLTQPEHATELHHLALADHRGVRLEQADQLLARQHRLALEHPPHRLLDDLCHAGEKRLEGLDQVLRLAIRRLLGVRLQVLLDLLGLPNHLLRQAQQSLVSSLHIFGRLLASPARRSNELLGDCADDLCSVVE